MEITVTFTDTEQAALTDLLYTIAEGGEIKLNGIQLRELASALVKIETGIVEKS